MFPTFTGSSRKPRQVNLSGQTSDPFAAWGGTASGTKSTVANAQKERAQRQAERDKLNAAKLLQRIWRGQRSRTLITAQRRADWDSLFQPNIVDDIDQSASDRLFNLPLELQLLSAFFNYRHVDDLRRLERLSVKFLQICQCDNINFTPLYHLLPRTIHMILKSFDNAIYPTSRSPFLRLLSRIVDGYPETLNRNVMIYYCSLSRLFDRISTSDYEDYIQALRNPLLWNVDAKHAGALVHDAQEAFALVFLTTESGQHIAQQLHLENCLEFNALCRQLAAGSMSRLNQSTDIEKLWLLANLINIRHAQSTNDVDMSYITLLSLLLSSTASIIAGKLGIDKSIPPTDDIEDERQYAAPQLPKFIGEQLLTLVEKNNILALLSLFSLNRPGQSTPNSYYSDLSKVMLMLLKTFPDRGEELRMWIYQSSILETGNVAQRPLVKFLWPLVKKTSVFREVVEQRKSGLSILSSRFRSDTMVSPDWQTTLLFLEVYAFALRFMDDEEFLSGGAPALSSEQRSSRSRDSALAISDVKALTIFLKEMAFTMFYNVKDLSVESSTSEGRTQRQGLGSNSTTSAGIVGDLDHDFLGGSGLNFLYVRGTMTKVMRMLYERDSRRRFLPRDHWLMTSRFDMENLISSVVDEEERRQEVEEDDEEDAVDDEVPEVRSQLDTYGPVVGVGRARLWAQMAEASIEKQRRHDRRRNTLATIGPKVEILQNMPFVIPFETRVQVFREFVRRDQLRRRGGTTDPDQWRMLQMGRPNRETSKHHATVRREHLVDDAMSQFYSLGEGLKEPIQITFVDQFGENEAGIDGGGVTKEFLTSIVHQAFHEPPISGPKQFVSNDQNLIYPNPSGLDEFRGYMTEHRENHGFTPSMDDWLKSYEFLGRIIGKCLYEGILVDITFAGFFLLKWATSTSTTSNYGAGLANINDLHELDESLQKGLLQLKNYPGDVREIVDQDFTITDPGWRSQIIQRELLQNGKYLPVTNENRIQYISLVANHRLNRQPYLVTKHFLKGLGDIIAPRWLSMFNQTELQTLIGGDSSEIDIEDLRRNTIYGGIYQIGDDGLEHPTVVMFWQALKEMDDAERRKLLSYVTSTPRAPLLGFSALNPSFSIRDAGSDQQRLPSTSTCINLLKLPRYDDMQVMRQKLSYAINSGAGFDLS